MKAWRIPGGPEVLSPHWTAGGAGNVSKGWAQQQEQGGCTHQLGVKADRQKQQPLPQISFCVGHSQEVLSTGGKRPPFHFTSSLTDLPGGMPRN